jgi:hypothetical protein
MPASNRTLGQAVVLSQQRNRYSPFSKKSVHIWREKYTFGFDKEWILALPLAGPFF